MLKYSSVVTPIPMKRMPKDRSSSENLALSSAFTLPAFSPPPPEDNPLAPRISNDRVKIHWSDLGIQAYSNVICNILDRLRSNWLLPSSPSSISVLLQTTNAILSHFAKETNKFTELNVVRCTHQKVKKEAKVSSRIWKKTVQALQNKKKRRKFKLWSVSPQFSKTQACKH